MIDHNRPVAIGFLSQRDLETLGEAFTRHFPLPESGEDFADLLAELDRLTDVPMEGAGQGTRPER